MVSESSSGEIRNRARLFTDGEPSTEDLFDLAKEIYDTHKTPPGQEITLPGIRIIRMNIANPGDSTSEHEPDQTYITTGNKGAGLAWIEGSVHLNFEKIEESDEGPFERINFEMESNPGRRADREYFKLEKYSSGNTKAFWLRLETTHSYILDEDLEDDYFEVSLDTRRIKRIGQVLLSASARTAVENVSQ